MQEREQHNNHVQQLQATIVTHNTKIVEAKTKREASEKKRDDADRAFETGREQWRKLERAENEAQKAKNSKDALVGSEQPTPAGFGTMQREAGRCGKGTAKASSGSKH